METAALTCDGTDSRQYRLVREKLFLLQASRNPSAHRSLIAFTAWSSFAHATVMGVQAFLNLIARRELLGVATFISIGVLLITLAPARESRAVSSAATAKA